MLIPEVVEKTLNAPWHLLKKAADIGTAPLRYATNTRYLPEDYKNKKGENTTVYEIANPMMDITTSIYYYTELRSETKKRLKEYAKSKKQSEGDKDKGLSDEDLEVIRNAISSQVSSSEEIENLKKEFKLGDGDIQVFKVYFDILSEPKDIPKIKRDFELYGRYISFAFRKSFGGEKFNFKAVDDMAKRDPDMFIHHIDDDFATTIMNLVGGAFSDVVYAIVVSPTSKRIIVVFRGSVNIKDWTKNFQPFMTDFELPGFTTAEAEKDKRETYGLAHKGYYDYLFGETKLEDSSNHRNISKAEEIMGTLVGLLNKEEYKGFSVYVTGHSLGAYNTVSLFRSFIHILLMTFRITK